MEKSKRSLTQNKQPLSAEVPATPDLWSDSSKQSYVYQSSFRRMYSDRHYTCRRCKQAAVFTAQEQREAYEVRKAYIWQDRVLCAECFATRMKIEAGLRACALRWQAERDECQADTPFLQRWHSLLLQHVEYGGNRDEGNICMLQALLSPRSDPRSSSAGERQSRPQLVAPALKAGDFVEKGDARAR